jgi:hypothetical protein
LRITDIVKASKKLLVLTGFKLYHQADDAGAAYFVHNLVIIMKTYTDEQLLKLTPEQAKALTPEQITRRDQLRAEYAFTAATRGSPIDR